MKVRLPIVVLDWCEKSTFFNFFLDGWKLWIFQWEVCYRMISTLCLPTICPIIHTYSSDISFRTASSWTKWSWTFCCKVDGLQCTGGRGTVHHQPPPVWDHPPSCPHPPHTLTLPASLAGMCPWNMCNFPLKLEGPEPWKAPQVLAVRCAAAALLHAWPLCCKAPTAERHTTTRL